VQEWHAAKPHVETGNASTSCVETVLVYDIFLHVLMIPPDQFVVSSARTTTVRISRTLQVIVVLSHLPLVQVIQCEMTSFRHEVVHHSQVPAH
jgi:hypothetical protein